MAAGGVKTPTVLDELEGHLREEFQARILAGDSEDVAFETAAARIGSAGSLQSEFNKISAAVSLPVLIGVSIWVGAVVLGLILFSHRVAAGMHWYEVMNNPPLQLFMGVHLLFLLMHFRANSKPLKREQIAVNASK